ncbi:hypothetical protein B7494_g4758 [Chlorociboria aeruginascens]|nr:hypothetical protein B7494_g4758 [Chlorociboria aeruginascens]
MINFTLNRIFDYALNKNAALVLPGLLETNNFSEIGPHFRTWENFKTVFFRPISTNFGIELLGICFLFTAPRLPYMGVLAVVSIAQRESCLFTTVRQQKRRFQNDLVSLLQNILAHNGSPENETSSFVVNYINLPITTSDNPGVNILNTTLLLLRSPISPLITLWVDEISVPDTLAYVVLSSLGLPTSERKSLTTPLLVDEEKDDELQSDEIFIENQDRDIDEESQKLSTDEEDLGLESDGKHLADNANDDLSEQAFNKIGKIGPPKLSPMWIRSLDVNLQISHSGHDIGAHTVEDLPDILCNMSNDYEFTEGHLEKIMEVAAGCGLANADDIPNPEMEGHEAVVTYRRRVSFALERLAAQMLSLKSSKQAAKCELNQNLYYFMTANADQASRERLLRIFTHYKPDKCPPDFGWFSERTPFHARQGELSLTELKVRYDLGELNILGVHFEMAKPEAKSWFKYALQLPGIETEGVCSYARILRVLFEALTMSLLGTFDFGRTQGRFTMLKIQSRKLSRRIREGATAACLLRPGVWKGLNKVSPCFQNFDPQFPISENVCSGYMSELDWPLWDLARCHQDPDPLHTPDLDEDVLTKAEAQDPLETKNLDNLFITLTQLGEKVASVIIAATIIKRPEETTATTTASKVEQQLQEKFHTIIRCGGLITDEPLWRAYARIARRTKSTADFFRGITLFEAPSKHGNALSAGVCTNAPTGDLFMRTTAKGDAMHSMIVAPAATDPMWRAYSHLLPLLVWQCIECRKSDAVFIEFLLPPTPLIFLFEPRRETCRRILGGTGAVGQRFILLLSGHPYLEISAIGASERSAGKTYAEAAQWRQSEPIPATVASLVVQSCRPELFNGCDIIFSGLDTAKAHEVELAFARLYPVFSNASAYRMDPLTPLVVPTVNLSHMSLIPAQRQHLKAEGKGFLVTNSNCAVIGIVIPFAALQAKFGRISEVSVVTLQALSGAGYPGVSSMDIIDNIVPYIESEESKIETEACKILGNLSPENNQITPQQMKVSAACNRVPVLDGHTACVSLRFATRPPPTASAVKAAMKSYISEAQILGCYSAPTHSIIIHEDPTRPQPRLDRNIERGYAVSVGRVREDESGIFDIKFVALSHNTIIGAAGSSIFMIPTGFAGGLPSTNLSIYGPPHISADGLLSAANELFWTMIGANDLPSAVPVSAFVGALTNAINATVIRLLVLKYAYSGSKCVRFPYGTLSNPAFLYKKVLLLGSGFVARTPLRTQHFLGRAILTSRHEKVPLWTFSQTLASKTLENAEKLSKGVKLAHPISLDVTDESALDTEIRKHDLVISLIPYDFHVAVIKSAIREKKHVVTTSYVSAGMMELDQQCKDAGITVMNEIGLDPGIDHLYALKTIEEVHEAGKQNLRSPQVLTANNQLRVHMRRGKITSFLSYCGGLPAPEDSGNPNGSLGYKFSWSSRGVLLALRNSASYYQNGKIVNIAGHDLMAQARQYHIYPGFAFVAYPNRDSTPYKQRYNIPEATTIIRGTLRYAGFPEFVKVFVDMGFLSDEEQSFLKEKISWAEATQKILGASSSNEMDLVWAISSKATFKDTEEKERLLAGLKWIGIFSSETIIPRGNPLDTLCATLEKKMQFEEGERDLVMLQHKFEIEYKDGKKETKTSTLCEYGAPVGSNGYSAMAKLSTTHGDMCSVESNNREDLEHKHNVEYFEDNNNEEYLEDPDNKGFLDNNANTRGDNGTITLADITRALYADPIAGPVLRAVLKHAQKYSLTLGLDSSGSCSRPNFKMELGKKIKLSLTYMASPRMRAVKTFELLLPPSFGIVVARQVTYTEDIAEWDYGDYEGLKNQEIRVLRKERGLDLERESRQQVTERVDRNLTCMGRSPLMSFLDKQNRVQEWGMDWTLEDEAKIEEIEEHTAPSFTKDIGRTQSFSGTPKRNQRRQDQDAEAEGHEEEDARLLDLIGDLELESEGRIGARARDGAAAQDMWVEGDSKEEEGFEGTSKPAIRLPSASRVAYSTIDRDSASKSEKSHARRSRTISTIGISSSVSTRSASSARHLLERGEP